MVDKDRIFTLINVINENLDYINQKNITSVDKFKKSKDDYYSSSMALFTIQNKLIELAEELLDSLNKDYYPKKYLDIINKLFEEKIISDKIFSKFKTFIEYRNEIAHEYEGISENEIFWCIQNLDFIKDFFKIIKERLLK